MSKQEEWLNKLPQKWQSELKNAQLRGKIAIEDLLRFQTLRCQATFGEEQEAAIRLLHEFIPDTWRDEEFKNDVDKAITVTEKWLPATIDGVTYSDSIDNPVIINDPNDLDYDPKFYGRKYKKIPADLDLEAELEKGLNLINEVKKIYSDEKTTGDQYLSKIENLRKWAAELKPDEYVEIWKTGETHQVSPILKPVTETDYGALFHACWNLFDRKNLLISKIPKETIPAGKEENEEEEEDDNSVETTTVTDN